MTTRRTIIKSAAWALPVIAAAVALPLATASELPGEQPRPIRCEKGPNHGHGGNTANQWWQVYYSDGSVEMIDNGTVMSTRELRELCK